MSGGGGGGGFEQQRYPFLSDYAVQKPAFMACSTILESLFGLFEGEPQCLTCSTCTGALCMDAIKHGIANGRHGKGSIYVFAAGNGRREDNCNADGYTNR